MIQSGLLYKCNMHSTFKMNCFSLYEEIKTIFGHFNRHRQRHLTKFSSNLVSLGILTEPHILMHFSEYLLVSRNSKICRDYG